jgi:hypothetical protein
MECQFSDSPVPLKCCQDIFASDEEDDRDQEKEAYAAKKQRLESTDEVRT